MVSGLLRLMAKRVAALHDRVVRPRPGLVVLAYHRVGRTSSIEVDLPVDTFDRQMAAVARSGAVLTLDEAVAGIRAGRDLAGRVVVTFDDGTADFADHALPVLDCYQVPATVYVATRHIDEQISFPDDGKPLSWAALAECVASGLVTVGSHTHSHRLLDRVDAPTAAAELDRSQELISHHLGVTADHFAYPKALAAAPAVEPEVRLRFRSAALAGTRPNPLGVDPYRLSRSPVQFSDGREYFDRKIAGGMALEDDLRRLLNRRRYAGAER